MRRPGIECSGTVAVSLNGFTNFLDPLEQRNFSGGGRECGEVTGIGGQGDLGSSFEVNHASAQNTPGLFSRVAFSAAMGTDLGLAKDAMVVSMRRTLPCLSYILHGDQDNVFPVA